MNNNKVIDALRCPPRERTDEEIKLVFHYLRQLDVFRILADGPLKSIAETARYERHPKDHILFRKGQSATCWFILMSGSVLMNNQIYLPSGCFGKRSGMNLRRSSDCLVIQQSDMIVIDYPDVQRIPVRYGSGSATLGRPRNNHGPPPAPSIPPPLPHRTQAYHQFQPPPFKTNGAGYSLRHSGDLAYEFHQQFAAQSSHGQAHHPPPPPHTNIPVHRSYNPSPTRPFQTFVGVVAAEKPAEDYSDATLTHSSHTYHQRNSLAHPTVYTQKRVPSPAPRSASISVCGPNKDTSSSYTYHETNHRPMQQDMWQTALPSTSTHFNRPFAPNAPSNGAFSTNHASEPQPKRASLHENQLAQLTDSFDSGVQLKSNSSSNSSQPPPPAPFIADFPTTMDENGSQDRFLAPSAQRINKMRVQLSRKNSDDSNSSIRMRSHSNAQSALLNARRFRGRSTASSSTTDGDEFAGLPETAVDSDDDDDEEESIPSHDFSYMELKDNVRECLEKEPAERNSDDIHVLMEFMQQMPALASLPLSIKRQLCLKMVFAVVPEAGTVILHDAERIDSWSVVVNGAVETVRANGERLEYRLGDAFGAQPQPQPQFNDGETRTLCDDCEFVLVEHQDYCSIMSTLDQHIEQENDHITGEIVREAERRVVGSQVALVIIKAKPDRLIQHLVDETDPNNIDDSFPQDFFLMYRVFIADPTIIMHRLLEWFQDRRYRDKVTCLLLHWVNSHFNDFECSQEMLKLLDAFEQSLEKFELYHQQSLLNITCSVKSHPRQATLTRSNRDQELAFSIIGGNAHHPDQPASDGIFIANVEAGSPAEKNGLKRGDEIIEANGQNFRTIPLTKALDILRESTHLSLTIKSNMMNYKEMLMRQESGSIDHSKHAGTMGRYQKKSLGYKNKMANAGSQTDLTKERNGAVSAASSGYSSATATPAAKASMFDKLKTMLKGQNGPTAVQEIDLETDSPDETRNFGTLRTSRSNPDISSNLREPHLFPSHHSPSLHHRNPNQFPEHAVKVYRSDQSFRFVTVFPDTTARQIVQMALLEFGMQSEASQNEQEWSLCECICSVAEKRVFIKQRRLPDDLQNLAERIGLASRLYLKSNTRSETLLPDELAPEVMKEAKINLYALNAQFVAIQLTLQDFDLFSSIESTEYVDNLFQLESRYGWPKLQVFEEQFNKEMWWVVTEICLERTVSKRAKTIKKFIKIARHCRDLRNFNSMFAIISGLEKPAVRRLTHTWERIPGKYMKMLADIQGLLDPSRNMSKYRQHLASVSPTPPVIPIYPIMRKDLTFAHESKPTCCGALINFDKLRMIARIIRSVTMLCSVKYDLEFMSAQAAINEMNGAGTVRKAMNGSNTLNGTVKSLGNLSRKKLYEQTLMRRKVKTYLTEMPVIDNENELDQLSLACEPGQAPPNTGQSSVSLARRRVPSPTPSSLSSQSNQSDQAKKFFQQHAKFGVESPQAIQKMLSLVQNSKVKPNASPSPLIPPKKPSSTFSTSTLKRIPSFGAAAAKANGTAEES